MAIHQQQTNQTHGLSDIFNPSNLLISPSSEMGYESRLLHKKNKGRIATKKHRIETQTKIYDIYQKYHYELHIVQENTHDIAWSPIHPSKLVKFIGKKEKPSSCTKLSPPTLKKKNNHFYIDKPHTYLTETYPNLIYLTNVQTLGGRLHIATSMPLRPRGSTVR